MNRIPIEVGEWYHCYNRGVDKRKVFASVRDYDRFLTLLFLANGYSNKRVSNVRKMPVDEVVDLLKVLPKDEADVFLSQLKNVKLKKIENLIDYEDDTAGGLMTTGVYVISDPGSFF
jgi:magnesium transporter